MEKIKTFIRLIGNKEKFNRAIADSLGRSYFARSIPTKLYLKILFKLNIGKRLNLKNPKTFNEKLQWIKVYYKRDELIRMVDKNDVKNYIAETIGDQYVIPTLGIWDDPEKIDFDSLPDSFVLKCTHDSGSTLICRSKERFDFEYAKGFFRKKLKNNMYWWSREWPYKKVFPRIIAEPLLTDDNSNDLLDYKLMCFDGEVKCSFICSERNTNKGLHVTFYDRDWNMLPFERSFPREEKGFPKPTNYDKMIELSEKLSAGLPFVRVDFYDVNGRLYFGELTFFPGAGMEKFTPEEWDCKLGEWIKLPEK